MKPLSAVSVVTTTAVFVGGGRTAAPSIDCQSHVTITSPSSASALGASCPHLDGDLLIAAGPAPEDGNGSSSFILDGLRTVRGRLAFRDCDADCGSRPSPHHLTSSTLERVGGDLDVSDARALAELVLPALREVGGAVRLQNLPRLARLDVGALATARGAFVLAAAPALVDLAVAPAGFEVVGRPGRVRVHDVGLADVDGFLRVPTDAYARDLRVSAIPRVAHAELALRRGGAVEVAGNGRLVLGFGRPGAAGAAPAHIDSLTLAGVAALHWAGAGETPQDVQRPGQAFTVGRLAVRDNAELTALPVLWESVSSLDVRNNAALADVWIPDEVANPGEFRRGLRNLSIADNPQLALGEVHNHRWNDTALVTSLRWPSEDMSAVVLDGVVHDAFFRGLVDAHYHTNPQNMNTSRPRILNNFQVNSSVPNFHCAALDDLRRRGAIPGRYNCNGNGVDMLSGGSGRWHRGRGGGGIEWLPVALASAVCTWLLSAYP